ncbi:MAG TPA: glycosyltransferase family 39 protein [Myxococcaceae bacterium]|nr:glycosyltransferase family 39 protein [Myxococcaceae bacterium]
MLQRLERYTPQLVAAAYLMFALPLLPLHGVTYDAPALYYAGDRTLFFLTHPGVPGALSFASRQEPPGFHSFFSRDDEWEDPMRYPVLPGLLAAVVSVLVHDGLGLLDPAAAHHLGLVLLNALALWLFALYAIRFLGQRAGAFAAVALMLFPSAFGHAFNNPKDWPCAMFYGLAVLAAGEGLVSGRGRDILAAGLFAGISLAAKLNGVFVLVTLALWAPVIWFSRIRRAPQAEKYRLAAACLAAPYIAGFVFVASWPWIWNAPPAGIVERMSRYLSFMAAYGVSARDSWTWHPLKCLVFMTPPVVLLASAVALVAWVRRRDPEATVRVALLVSWVAVPYLRSMVPRSNFYDANRHFIEYVPGLCALAGWGFAELIERVERAARRSSGALARPSAGAVLRASICGVAGGSMLVPLLRYAPFETAYFNVLTGGLGGAQARALFRMPPPTDPRSDGTEGDYWYQSLRVAFIEAARRVPTPATIALCNAPEVLGQANLTGQAFRPVRFNSLEGQAAPIVWISPREGGCGWRQVRALESERPVLLRVERGGGLIYELLGPRSDRRLEPVSAGNAYTGGA